MVSTMVMITVRSTENRCSGVLGQSLLIATLTTTETSFSSSCGSGTVGPFFFDTKDFNVTFAFGQT